MSRLNLKIYEEYINDELKKTFHSYGEEMLKFHSKQDTLDSITEILNNQLKTINNMAPGGFGPGSSPTKRIKTVTEMEYKNIPPTPPKSVSTTVHHNFKVDQIVKVTNIDYEIDYAYLRTPEMDKLIGQFGKIAEIKGDFITLKFRFPDKEEWIFYNLLPSSLEALKNTYSQEQQKSNIKKGDYVQILRIANTFENGWNNNWNPIMNNCVGQLGLVVDDDNDGGLSIQTFNLREPKRFPCFILQKLEIDDCKILDYNPFLSIQGTVQVEREKIFNKLSRLGIFDKEKLKKIIFEE